VLVVEAMRGGGRGARRWWGDVRHSRKRCSPAGEAWGGGGRGAMSGSARSGGVGSIGQHEVGQVARGVAWAGWARAWGRSVGRAGFGWTVGSR
jgi:hypothetical protein